MSIVTLGAASGAHRELHLVDDFAAFVPAIRSRRRLFGQCTARNALDDLAAQMGKRTTCHHSFVPGLAQWITASAFATSVAIASSASRSPISGLKAKPRGGEKVTAG
jgi:hypothetical protein